MSPSERTMNRRKEEAEVPCSIDWYDDCNDHLSVPVSKEHGIIIQNSPKDLLTNKSNPNEEECVEDISSRRPMPILNSLTNQIYSQSAAKRCKIGQPTATQLNCINDSSL